MKILNRFMQTKLPIISALLVTLLISVLSACSPAVKPAVYQEGKPLSIEIFAGRGFLGGSSYERYYLANKVLWRECGSVTRDDNAKSSDLLPAFEYHPNLKLTNTGKEVLSENELQKIAATALDLFNSMSDKDRLDLPEPESLFSLANAGVFEIRISYDGKDKSFITSLDRINTGLLGNQKTARKLFTQVRGVGPVMCGSRTFFGIERR